MTAAPRPCVRRGWPAACRLVAAAACLIVGAPASAQPARLGPYRLAPIGQVLLPDNVPLNREERTVGPGDIVLRGRLGYRTAATVTEPIDMVIADQPIRIMPGQLLAENLVTGGASRPVRGGRFFCASARQPVEPPGTPGIRFDRTVQPCFVDSDRDGRLDFALLAGAGLQAELVLFPIRAVPYTVQTDIPLRAELRVVFNGQSLVCFVEIPNIEMNYVGGLAVRGADGRMGGFPRDQSVRKDSYPHVLSFQSARIEILGYDRETRRARLRVLEGFTRADADVSIMFTYGRRQPR